jgi:hypothetical protein
MISCAYQKGAMTPMEVCEGLGLYDLKNRLWHIQGSCALKGDGLYEGLDWLAGTLKELQASGRLPSGGTSLFWVEGISDQRSLSKTRDSSEIAFTYILYYTGYMLMALVLKEGQWLHQSLPMRFCHRLYLLLGVTISCRWSNLWICLVNFVEFRWSDQLDALVRMRGLRSQYTFC